VFSDDIAKKRLGCSFVQSWLSGNLNKEVQRVLVFLSSVVSKINTIPSPAFCDFDKGTLSTKLSTFQFTCKAAKKQYYLD
jgi:hypothetical protein